MLTPSLPPWNVSGESRASLISHMSFFKHFFNKIFYLFLQRGKGGRRGRETSVWERNINAREKHLSVASHMRPDLGLKPHPGHVPWLGI